MTTSEAGQPSAVAGAALGAGLGCLFGGFVALAGSFVIVLVLNQFNPVCGTPADSGGCEMGLVSIPIQSIVPGAFIGIAIGVALGVWRAYRKPQPQPPSP